jgi:beta-lactamase regulating signal transducer with metallopeptidase domain
MTLVFAVLLDMTLKASLLCLLCFGMAAIARQRSAALRHDLWLAALASCALLPAVALAFRLIGPTMPIAPVHEAVMAITPSLPAAVPAGAIEAIDRIWSGDGDTPQLGWVSPSIAALWVVGVLVTALRGLTGFRAAAQIVHRASPCPRLSARAGIRVLVSEEVDAPAVFGALSTVILLPAEATQWSAERLDAVFAHERAHVERRDCAVEVLVQIAGAIHWFNPMVHAAARALRREREFACDGRVVAAGADAPGYASALV